MFQILKTSGAARRGTFTTPHGAVQTPVFMNVGTLAAIKGAVSTRDLETVGCQVELSNTYHLHLRPGEEIVRDMGGLHGFMNWPHPILTDSGGFQVFSLAGLRRITEEGVRFHAHTDGHLIHMTPERSIQIQAYLGSDIAMAFDECVENPSPREYVEKSVARTLRWLARCKAELARLHREDETCPNPGQMLFGINQGGVYDDIRVEHMKRIAELDLPGYAIGGLAVGETAEEMYRIIEAVNAVAPADKPRYLMGVGTPSNILEAVARGVDFFDCVMPARNARHGHVYTWAGVRNLNNEKYARDADPIEPGCGCPACREYSRAYIRHLFRAGESLAGRLATLHNLYFYNHLTRHIREAIEQDAYETFRAKWSGVLSRRI